MKWSLVQGRPSSQDRNWSLGGGQRKQLKELISRWKAGLSSLSRAAAAGKFILMRQVRKDL